MFLHINLHSVSPVGSKEPINLLQNICFNFTKKQYFYSSRTSNIAKVALSMSNPSPTCSIATRVSRVARNEAQDVLFDYLHCTRNLQFTDAEHISKNSPAFLQNLLSKVDNDQEITRSLSRFLRYNPINEFEPFFESLGLAPSELPSLLPRDLMFLSDDDVLLENYHVLCNYGIPRSKIGKMYKEETEIFRYEYGVLASKLKAYEDLGLSKPTVIALVTCCPTLLIGGVNPEFGLVLKMLNGLEIEYDWIRGYLSDENTYNWNKMLNMMGFLEEMGCSKKDMRRLFNTHPGFLFEDSGKKIYILVALLLKIGISTKNILSLFLQHPRILAGNFAKNLWGALHFLSEIRMETEDIAQIISTHTHILGYCTLKKKPRTVLSRLEIGPEKLCEIIKEDPHKLIDLASLSNISTLKKASNEEGGHLLEKTTFLLSIGYVENSDEMVKALKQFRGRGDQLQERFDCLVNAGLDCHVVSNMIKVAPPVLNQSKDVIEMKIKYLVNHLGYPLQSVVAFPTYLCYDIERIKLRFSMYVWLREQGAAKPMLALSTILACSDARFVKYLVNLHSEGPAVWERLNKSSSSS
ncbi:Mitochodrial transcription termination factor-related [Macleaya cordata]|uniref:Mitochodrial transcription termination factor-related n=1 Tax=Macleaya cordata TaxID=56857 RepID=A0A200Q854_MACCD|nr:Mitochodrial transcription termination factor-related [Macleaya cordata]